VQPTLELSETYVRGTAFGGGGRGEFITRVSPGLRWSSRSGPVQGNVNYSLDATHYSERQGEQAIDHRLNANASAELLDERAYIDLRATSGRQAISAFGPQFASSDLSGNANRTSVTSVEISPYVRGRVGGIAELLVRLTAAATDAKDVASADSNSRGALVALSSTSGGMLGWSLNAQRQSVSFRQGNDTTSDRVSATVSLRPDIDWRLFVRGGRESTDVGALIKRQYDNYGGGLAWTPSPRTNIALESDRRFFGTGHRALLEYRTPRAVLRYTDSRDTTNGGDLGFNNRPVTLFDLFFQQFAPNYPDPVAREQAVNDFLRLLGRNGSELINVGALADVVSLQRRQELAYVWNGRRAVLTLLAYVSDVRAIDQRQSVVPLTPLPERTRQRGLNASVSHRLTPQTTVSLSASRQATSTSGALQGNRLDVLSGTLSSLLGERLGWNLTLRYSDFSGGSTSYHEAAASAALNLRF
jgi:uncharacterized protein (PEP-CTERM system associated)